MDPAMFEREQLEQAIAAQEKLRGILDNAIIEATIAALKKQLEELEATSEPEQRKLVSILFMDIVSSTEMVRNLDPEDNLAIMDTALQRLSVPIEQYGGRVTRYMGDGFKAVFGLPLAHENDPVMAVRAGLGILAAAEEYAREVEEKWGIQGFNVRVGINTGLVVSGGQSEGEDTIAGSAINLAARLESGAEPGTLLVSHHTYQHIRGVFDLKPHEPIQAKGFAEPVPVYRVLRAKERSFRTRRRGVEGIETRMVGRQVELKILQDSFLAVVEDGRQQMVTVIGEAGLGKSRLLYEFEHWVDLQPEDVLFYRGRARLETQRLPYGLLRDLFAFRFAIQDDEPAQSVRDKVISGLEETLGAGETTEMKAHFLGHLLGYDFHGSPHLEGVKGDPQQIRDRSLIYLTDYFKTASSHSPVLVLLEDLHWTDDSSLDIITELGMTLSEQPVLFVGTARPTLYERRPHWFEERTFHHRLDLHPLSRRDSRLLLEEVLQKVEKIPETLRELVISHAEGNPFYVEELVKMLIEDGIIVKGEERWQVQTDRLSPVHVPATLTGVLQARLDSLPQEERTVLQQAAVVGRVFWDGVVVYLNRSADSGLATDTVRLGLDALQKREMVYHHDLSAFAEATEYIFKHAILREVTYESVLKKRRRAYHALVAKWLIAQSGERTGEYIGLIATHLEQAGRDQEALAYLRKAGEEAASRYANEEAVDFYSRALAQAPESDLQIRIELLLEREKVLDLQGKRQAQRRDLESLNTLTKQLEVNAKHTEAALRWASFYEVTGNYQTAAAEAERAVAMAESAGETQLAARGQLVWGRALWYQGQYKAAREHYLQALAGFRVSGDRLREGRALNNLGIIAFEQRDNAMGQGYHQQALAIARETGDRVGEVYSLNALGVETSNQGDFPKAQDYYEQALAIARETGNRLGEERMLSNLGSVAVDRGDYLIAQGYYEQALAIARETGNRRGEAYALRNIGFVAATQGDYPTAERYYERTLAIARATGLRLMEANTLNYLGIVASDQGNYLTARNYLEQALFIARETGFREGEEIALVGLGDILAGLKRWQEAVQRYQQAIELREEVSRQHLAAEARAGLARVALAQGNLGLARSLVEEILAHLERDGLLRGTLQPFRIYLTCVQVLQAAGDTRAVKTLDTAYTRLQAYAARIQAQALRRSFLRNVPWHREIVTLWEAQHG